MSVYYRYYGYSLTYAKKSYGQGEDDEQYDESTDTRWNNITKQFFF